MSETARARRYLVEGEAALALGVCEGALPQAEGEEALALRLLAARAAQESGDAAARVEHLEQAEVLARRPQLAGQLGIVLLELGRAQLARGAPARAADCLGEAVEALGEAPELAARAGALLDEARALEEELSEAAVEAEAGPEPSAEDSDVGPDLDRDGELGTPESERLLAMLEALLEEPLPLAGVLDLVLAELVQAVGAARGFVLLRDPDQGLVIHAARDAKGRAVPEPAREVSRRIAEQAASEARSLRAVRPAEDPRFAGSRSAKVLDLQAVVAAPLRYRRVDLGVVVLDRRGQGKQLGFSDEQEALVARFARLASAVIVQVRRREADERRAAALEDLYARGLSQLNERFDASAFLGQSQPAFRLLRLVERVAGSDVRVLVRGESGTGKEVVARLLHDNSPRRECPFLALNCAAVPEALLEAELFGHVAGAFSGAEGDREGLFQKASGGTLFLDEIGDASPRLQAELLRVLETGEVRRVGSGDVSRIDVRVLSATHQDLERMVAEGRFREDLLFRLNTIQIRVPALRERPEDIPLLAHHFARQARELVTSGETFALGPEVVAELQGRPWPGNVRELKNAITRYVAVGQLDPASGPAAPPMPQPEPLPIDPQDAAEPAVITLQEAERRAIVRALRHTGGAKKEAAKLLNVARRTLYNKIRAYGLE